MSSLVSKQYAFLFIIIVIIFHRDASLEQNFRAADIVDISWTDVHNCVQ